MRELIDLLTRTLEAAEADLAMLDTGGFKIFKTGPAGASIDGTPVYQNNLRNRIRDLEQALTLAKRD
jgi:hypothetical protein